MTDIMQDYMSLFLLIITVFLVTWLGVWLVRWLAIKYKWVTPPSTDRWHKKPTAWKNRMKTH